MNVRIFWVCAMKCMYAQTRPRFILSSEGVFGGMEFEPMLTPREKSPLPKMSPEEDRTRDTVDSEPKHYQLSYSGPLLILFVVSCISMYDTKSSEPKENSENETGRDRQTDRDWDKDWLSERQVSKMNPKKWTVPHLIHTMHQTKGGWPTLSLVNHPLQ